MSTDATIFDGTALAATVKAAGSVLFLALFWFWESLQPFLEQRRGRLSHAVHNLAISIFNTTLLSLMFGAMTAGVAAWTSRNHLGLLNYFELGWWNHLALAVVLQDAWMYVWHRANHRIAFLWRFHRMHHSDNAMDVTTATRFHIGEHIGASLLRFALIPLMGLNILDLVIYQTLVVGMTMFHHANISIGRWDYYLNCVFVTPFMHKIHHSRVPRETNSNYSTLFSFWDRLAFSLRGRDDCSTIQFGLHGYEDPKWQTFLMMLKTPLREPDRPDSGNAIRDGTPAGQGHP